MLKQMRQWLMAAENRSMVAWLVFFAALMVRLIGLVLVPETHISTNARTAILNGAELIRGGQFLLNPDYPLQIPPLAALFTAAVQAVFGERLLYVKLAQVLLDAVGVAVLFQIALRMLPYPAALLAGAGVAFYPFTAFTPLYIGSEMLFAFFLALFVWAAMKALDGRRAMPFLVAGLFLGMATLARGTTQYFPLVFLAYLYFRVNRSFPAFFARGAMFALGFALIVGPWIARNLVVVDAFVMSSTPGLPLLNGSSEEFWEIRDRNRRFPEYFAYLREHRGIAMPENPSWIEKHRFYTRAAIEKYRERWERAPSSYVPFLVKKFARLWYATETGNNHLLVLLINAPIYLLALAGAAGLWRQRHRDALFVGVLLGYFAAIHVAVYALFRFLVPVVPYLILFAAYGAMQWEAAGRMSRWLRRFPRSVSTASPAASDR